MKRKAFKTSPSVRIPRAAVEKLQESKVQAQAQAQAQAQEIIRLETSVKAIGKALEKAIDAYARRHQMHFDALRDLMAYLDKVRGIAGDGVGWTVADVKRIEEIRLLSIGV